MTKSKSNSDPWEKQKSESSKAYAAFCTYRDMGVSRSLAKIVNIVYGESKGGKPAVNLRQISTWSSKYGWVARAEAYDVYLEAKERHENEKAIKDMAKRHAQASLLTMSKAVDRIKLIGEDDDKELTAKEALEYLRISAELERKSRGAPDQIIEHGGEVKGASVVVYLPDNKRDSETTDTESETKDN